MFEREHGRHGAWWRAGLCTALSCLIVGAFCAVLHTYPATLNVSAAARGFLGSALPASADSVAAAASAAAQPASSYAATSADVRRLTSCKVQGHAAEMGYVVERSETCEPLPANAAGGSLDFIVITPKSSGSKDFFSDLISGHPYISSEVPCKHLFGGAIPYNASRDKAAALMYQHLPKRCQTHLELRGDAGARYWTNGLLPPFLAMLLPAVKLIAILRDPVVMLLANVMSQKGFMDTPRCQEELQLFYSEEAAACNKEGRVLLHPDTGVCGAGYFDDEETDREGYIRLGMYSNILDYWGQFFSISGAERQILVMLSDWFEGQQSEQAFQKVARFLGIPGWTDTDLQMRQSAAAPSGKPHRSDGLMAQYELFAGLGSVPWWCNADQIRQLRSIYAPSNKGVRDHLVAAFTADGERLSDWPFPDWLEGYQEDLVGAVAEPAPAPAPAPDALLVQPHRAARGQSCKVQGETPPVRCDPVLGKADGGALQFVVISPSKSGTTALFQDLVGGHPFISNQIPCKEMHLFDDYIPLNATHDEALRIMSQVLPRPCETHLELIGEGNPRYFALPTAPPMLARHVPAAKLLVPLRDPVKRYMSNLMHGKDFFEYPKCTVEIQAFLEEEADNCERQERSINPESGTCDSGITGRGLVRVGLYMDILEYWGKFHKLRGSDRNMLVLATEWLQNWDSYDKSEQTLQKVARFLGLPAWTEYDLARRPTAVSHVGTKHLAKMHKFVKRSDIEWWCNEQQIRQLRAIYATSNAKVREHIISTFKEDGENMKDWPLP
eukprot:CAMPEP_0178375552 /NCGR_PEP_ID=MMETSP0689_2-20121128/2945_1 /TAXON_ID=160604 /ORGANISM="Amphidinium massartii, Strain CS-259" /LENGTH=781 /DNA_ID=CAMNT_0019995545 /DNA_START=1 /DNA_END=2343 /DNA_ORIENTATION=+